MTPEDTWQTWLTNLSRHRLMWGIVFQEDVDRLHDILRIGRERWQETVPYAPYTGLTVHRLTEVKEKEAPWMPRLCGRLREDLQLCMIGKPRDFQAVVRGYLEALPLRYSSRCAVSQSPVSTASLPVHSM